MYKVDLHTHSIASYDGGIKPNQYQQILDQGKLDYLAITDHNKIDLAIKLQHEFGNKIIVGEEIKTTDGEIIGLFLTECIPSGLSAYETSRAIKKQGGLVYIPHPFETIRSGMSIKTLEQIKNLIDIIEVFNGRAVLQNKSSQAQKFATKNKIASSASSDAHGKKGLAHTYSSIACVPTVLNLAEQLKAGQLIFSKPPLITLLYPKAHRIKKKFSK